MTTPRLSGNQAELLFSTLWLQAMMADNWPSSYEAMAHTYSPALLFSRPMSVSHNTQLRALQLALSIRNLALDSTALSLARRRSLFTLATVFEGRHCEAEHTLLLWFCHYSFDRFSEVSYLSPYEKAESTLAMQNLQPKIKAIQERYKGDQERIQLETARLYKQAGVNPIAGCLPTLATLPVWIGLYRALSNVANEGLLTEGFFWIQCLAGPTTIAARSSGSGISWLFPFVDGAPSLGWGDTISYLVLPILLIASQYVSMQMMQPATASNDPAQNQSQVILKFLPLMIGYFSLSVPSGLSLYWLTNNALSTAQQVYLRQLGGAQPVVDKDGGGIISAGQAKRTPLPPPVSTSAIATTATTDTLAKDAGGEVTGKYGGGS